MQQPLAAALERNIEAREREEGEGEEAAVLQKRMELRRVGLARQIFHEKTLEARGRGR